jgi:hypothetical protein
MMNMTTLSNGQSGVMRKEKGLMITGTRITLYDVMDYLKAQYPFLFKDLLDQLFLIYLQ